MPADREIRGLLNTTTPRIIRPCHKVAPIRVTKELAGYIPRTAATRSASIATFNTCCPPHLSQTQPPRAARGLVRAEKPFSGGVPTQLTATERWFLTLVFGSAPSVSNF